MNVHLQSRIIDGTFTDVTIDTVTNRAPTWWNDAYALHDFQGGVREAKSGYLFINPNPDPLGILARL